MQPLPITEDHLTNSEYMATEGIFLDNAHGRPDFAGSQTSIEEPKAPAETRLLSKRVPSLT